MYHRRLIHSNGTRMFMLQMRNSVWGRLAHDVYGRQHMRYRKRLFTQWRRPEGSLLRRQVLSQLGLAAHMPPAAPRQRRQPVPHASCTI